MESIQKGDENKSVTENKPLKHKKIKCQVCRKKCEMIHFTCRCGKIFCVKHQLPHNHNCQFNNQEKMQKEIQINNPKIEYSKIIKI